MEKRVFHQHQIRRHWDGQETCATNHDASWNPYLISTILKPIHKFLNIENVWKWMKMDENVISTLHYKSTIAGKSSSYENPPAFPSTLSTSGSFPKTPQPTSGQIRTCQGAAGLQKLEIPQDDHRGERRNMEIVQFHPQNVEPHAIIMVYNNLNMYYFNRKSWNFNSTYAWDGMRWNEVDALLWQAFDKSTVAKWIKSMSSRKAK